MKLDDTLRQWNGVMVGFDLVLGSGALLAPSLTLRALGHDAPSQDAQHLFRRCGPIWLTFAAGHALAAARGNSEDWWALAWLRATEMATDVVWSRSPAFTRPGARAGLWMAGLANVAMAAGYARLARSEQPSSR